MPFVLKFKFQNPIFKVNAHQFQMHYEHLIKSAELVEKIVKHKIFEAQSQQWNTHKAT